MALVIGGFAGFRFRRMERARSVPDLAARYWAAVETLAAEGDDDVKNSVHVSLIEWFAWGDEEDSRALHGSATLRA
jgi:hypothetical protein